MRKFYLDRKFTVRALSELAAKAKASFDPFTAEKQGLTRPFFRLIDPRATLKPQEIRDIPGLTGRVVAQALHCDWLPLDADFWPSLDRMAAHGGYGLTHAVLASGWIKENGCPVDTAPFKESEVVWIGKLIHLIDSESIPTDLRAEGLAMLFYAGMGTVIGADRLEFLLELQRPDGGWALDTDRLSSHAHTTSLALWILLELRYPDALQVPMILEKPR